MRRHHDRADLEFHATDIRAIDVLVLTPGTWQIETGYPTMPSSTAVVLVVDAGLFPCRK